MSELVTKDTLQSCVETIHDNYMMGPLDSYLMDTSDDIDVVNIIDPYYYLRQPLTMNILTDGTVLYDSQSGFWGATIIQQGLDEICYKKNDDTQWITMPKGTTIQVSAGDKVYLGQNDYYGWVTVSGGNQNPCWDSMHGPSVRGTATFTLSGNVMSMVNKDNFMNLTALTHLGQLGGLFLNNTKLLSVSNLVFPATTLTQACYASMFAKCTNLVSVNIVLPATTLQDFCYSQMFWKTAITEPVELPATTLVKGCYYYMFYGTNITAAPKLAATTLQESCYRNMFTNCASLTSVESAATDISATVCMSSWLSGVSATGTFKKNSNTTYPSGADGIPEGWTIVNTT